MKMTTSRAIVYGALTVGTLDLIDAFVFFGLRSHTPRLQILQSIAAGVVGRDIARAGGAGTGLLGLFAHYFVALCIVTVYVLVSRSMPALRKQWVAYGILYGVTAYFVMTWFIVPMSNAGQHRITFALPATAVFMNGILIHIFGVGLPAAYFASRLR
jgi:hypothetical protein